MTPAGATSQTGRRVLLNAVTERQWQSQVEAWAKRAGWRHFHAWQSLHSPSGFPDLVLIRPPRLIFVELKKNTGKLSQAQRDWLADLLLVPGVEVHVWRPRDEAVVRAALDLTRPAAYLPQP